MTDGERGRFYRLLGPGTSEAAARAEFETGAHQWVFVHQRAVFEGLLKRSPNPIEEALDVESYFDANYEKLGPTPAYIWFQARMCITAFDEQPVPTFAQALKQTTP